MGHGKDRWNIEFDGTMVKDLSDEQILDWLGKGLNQFDDGVLREELRWRAARLSNRPDMEFLHAKNIGLIVLALAQHEPGDFGDCSINDPVTSIVDMSRPAHELLQALASMKPETAAGLVDQYYGQPATLF